MLFVHFIDMKAREANEPVIQIPDEIHKRMCSYANSVFISPKGYNIAGLVTGISIINKDNKAYIAFSSKRSATTLTRYHYTIYLLKET